MATAKRYKTVNGKRVQVDTNTGKPISPSGGGSNTTGPTVTTGPTIDTNYQMKPGETVAQYNARIDAYNASKNTTPTTTTTGTKTTITGNDINAGYASALAGNPVSLGATPGNTAIPSTGTSTDLKNLSVGLAGGTPTTTPTTTPEDYAKSIMDAMQGMQSTYSPEQSTQGSDGTQQQANDQVMGGVMPGGGTPGAGSITTATGGYTKIGPAYFQKTSDGLRAVSDASVIKGLKAGTIPYSTGQTDGTTFSKYSVPLADPAKQALADATLRSMGMPAESDAVNEGASIMTTYQGQAQKYGLTQTQSEFFTDPMKTISDITSQIFKASGMDEANTAIKDITGELEDLENKRDDEIADINDNPWLTEGVRLRQIASVEGRYEDKINNRTNKLRLLEDVRNNAQQSAQFAIGTAISLWDKERTFQQHQIDAWNEQAQNAIDNDFKMKAYDLQKETSYINSYLDAKANGFEGGYYEYMHPENNTGTSDWTMFNQGDGSTVMYNQRTGAVVPVSGGPTDKATSEAMNTVNDIENLISDPAFTSAYGLSNIAKRNIPGNPAYVVAQNHENLMASLALGARGKLKGQGAVSDFEGKLLRRAQTSLTLNMNPQQARFELTQVAGAIRTSSGGKAMVRITAPNGQSKVGEADQATINEAVASGYRVQYE